jgi:sortase (surface protein transpeptidase)
MSSISSSVTAAGPVARRTALAPSDRLAPADPLAEVRVVATSRELAVPGGGGRAPVGGPRRRRGFGIAGSALSLLALALLALVLSAVALSPVEHARSQRVAYAELRTQLAESTAPVGQLDVDGELLPLGAPVAVLDLPALGLRREVVFEGTTGAVLAKGPGHRRSTVLPGQPGVAVLYGRASAYGGPFGGAEDLRPGTAVTVTTGQGEHEYRVTGVRRPGQPVPPPPDAAAGEGRLTLVTASGPPFVPDRVVHVDADLVTPAVPAPARALRAGDLLAAEEALAGDSGAWAGLFLALQGLALAALAVAWGSRRWSVSHTWLAGVPVLVLLGVLASRQALLLLPNLL